MRGDDFNGLSNGVVAAVQMVEVLVKVLATIALIAVGAVLVRLLYFSIF